MKQKFTLSFTLIFLSCTSVFAMEIESGGQSQQLIFGSSENENNNMQFTIGAESASDVKQRFEEKKPSVRLSVLQQRRKKTVKKRKMDNSEQVEIFDENIESVTAQLSNLSVQNTVNVTSNNQNQQTTDTIKKQAFTFVIVQPTLKARKASPSSIIYNQYYKNFPECFKSALAYLENPHLFIKIKKGDISHQFLLHGTKGAGKSYLVELIAKKFRLPFLCVRGSTFEESLYGDTSKKITDLFNTRDPQKRTLILLIDEIDAIAARRRRNISDTARSTVTSFFDELSRHHGDLSLFTFATTNYINSIDDSVKSRFDVIEVKTMDDDLRKKYIKHLLDGYKIANTDQEIEKLSAVTTNLDRREIKKALGTARTGAIRTRLHADALPSIEEIRSSFEEKNESIAVSFGERFDRTIETWAPRLQFINSLCTLGYNFIVQPYLYLKGKEVQDHQTKNSDDSLALAKDSFAFAKQQHEEGKKNREEDLARAFKEHIERMKWDEFTRKLMIESSDVNYSRWTGIHNEMFENGLTVEEAKKKLGWRW